MAGLLTGVLFPTQIGERPRGHWHRWVLAGPPGVPAAPRAQSHSLRLSPVSSLRLCGEASEPRGPPSDRIWGLLLKAPQLAGRLGQTTLVWSLF